MPRKLDATTMARFWDRRRAGDGLKKLARAFNLPVSTVSGILNGTLYADLRPNDMPFCGKNKCAFCGKLGATEGHRFLHDGAPALDTVVWYHAACQEKKLAAMGRLG